MPTKMGTGLSSSPDGYTAASSAAEAAVARVDREDLKLTLVFASSSYDLAKVVAGVGDVVGNCPVIGCSSAGEFSDEGATTGAVTVSVLSSRQLEVRLGLGRHLSDNLKGAVAQAVEGFEGRSAESLRTGFSGRTLFVLTDGLVGRIEELIEELVSQTAMQYQLFGGAAGDDGRFEQTFVFHNDEVVTDAFVCAEVLSPQPMAIGIRHGWRPVSEPLRVTGSDGAVVKELNGRVAWDVYREFAIHHGDSVDDDDASAYLMDHLLGVAYLPDEYKLRVPLLKRPDGSVVCAAEVPEGSLVRIMEAEDHSIVDSGGEAIRLARESLAGRAVAGALVFECVANRLKLGEQFAQEVSSMRQALGEIPLAGCNSYGQLARVTGSFTGLMSSTTLVCLVPQ